MGPDKGMKDGNWNRGDTKAGDFLERIKNNLTKIDRLESDIDKGIYKGKGLDRAKKELAEARIDNELSVGQFYGNKNASGKWGPMYEYENGQKQLNRKNINPDNTPNNVSQQEWDRYVAENYGHYPNRGRHDKKNNLNDLYNTDKHGYSHKSNLDHERTIEQINRTIAKQNKNFANVETVSGNSKSSSKSNMSDKPNGVSDEYWRDYTFNGGTRESWDEEQKRRKQNSKKTSKKSSSGSEYRRELEYNSRKNNW